MLLQVCADTSGTLDMTAAFSFPDNVCLYCLKYLKDAHCLVQQFSFFLTQASKRNSIRFWPDVNDLCTPFMFI